MDHQGAVTEAEFPSAQQRSEADDWKILLKNLSKCGQSEDLAELTFDVAEGLVVWTFDVAEGFSSFQSAVAAVERTKSSTR